MMSFILTLLITVSHAQTFIKGSTTSYLAETPTSIATAGGTTTLTCQQNTVQRFTGSSNQTVVLPDATTCSVGRTFLIANDSSGVLTIRNATPTTLKTAKAGDSYSFRLAANGTVAGTWSVETNFNAVSLTADVTGILPLINGGTNLANVANAGGVAFSTASAISLGPVGTSGQVLTSGGTGSPTWTSNTFPSTATAPCALVANTSNIITCLAATTPSRLLRTNGTTLAFSQADLTTDVTGVLPLANGGTNLANVANAGGLAFSTASTISLGPVGSSGQIATSGGTGEPAWITVLPLANGGTNNNAAASAGSVVFSNSTQHAYTAVGSSGQLLQSAGTGTPTWSTNTFPGTVTAPCALVANSNNTITCLAATTGNRVLRTNSTTLAFSQIDLTTDVTGILPVANGGTGANTLTANNVILGNGGTAVQFVAPGTSGNILTSNGTTWTSSAASGGSSDTSIELTNLGLATSVSSNAMTIALKQKDGSTDPASGTGAVKIAFRSATATTGAYSQLSVTGALSVVIPSSTTLGTLSGIAEFIYVYAINNAGTVELALSVNQFGDQGNLVSTSAISGGATRANMYSTSARASVPFRLIGRIQATEATAGTWATNAAQVSVLPLAYESIMTLAGNLERIERARGTCSTSSSISSSSSSITSISNIGSSCCDVTWATAWSGSSNLTCLVSNASGASSSTVLSTIPFSTAGVTVCASTGSTTTFVFELICMGPR